ncbi:toxic anion resistance protein [Burkholderia cenocepacia]|uniref:toxic anion resistance protein n=1 Tax=Burkholderia cenocepacia TaxID=95486 RepID=UPI002ABE9B75|nr:toxic anion resistance protein [Burkholderia cenocepacia]
MANNVVTVEALKRDVLPALFADAAAIGEYGATAAGSAAINEFSNLMERGSVSALAGRIGEIVAKLGDADPQRIAQPPTWIEKLTGHRLERQVRYQVARKALDELLTNAEGVAQSVRDTVRSLDNLLASHDAEARNLRAYIQAGREFLDENPEVGQVQAGALEFDRPRERLARKLANLATLLSSHEMSITQMKLTRAQAVDMLDRFSETSTVLVPVWRQHTLALIQTKNMNPAMVSAATKAHQALMRSLAKSLEGIEQ